MEQEFVLSTIIAYDAQSDQPNGPQSGFPQLNQFLKQFPRTDRLRKMVNDRWVGGAVWAPAFLLRLAFARRERAVGRCHLLRYVFLD